jgi:hypothetical protein
MKNFLRTSILFLMFFALAGSPRAQTKLFEFTFDNSLSASVGLGTFTNNAGITYTTDRNGLPNKAINIANTGTSATLLGLPLGNNARSISMWVKLNFFRPDFNFLYAYGTGTNPEGAFIKPNEARHFVPNHTASTTHNATGIWVHYVFTFDGTTSRIYVNDTLRGTLAATKNTANNSNIFRLGLTETGVASFFDGAIDDLQIYSGALSAQQVSALFNPCVASSLSNTTPISNLLICSGSSTTLTVQSDSSVNWFSTPTGGTSLATGTTFTTPSLTSQTTYYAQAGTVCLSNRLPIIINVSSSAVVSSPQILTDTAMMYCEGSQFDVRASTTGGTLRWYNAPTGGILLDTGGALKISDLQSSAGLGQAGTITYYVEAFNSCSNPSTTPRIPVTIKVGTPAFSTANATPPGNYFACSGSFASLSVSTNANTIQWRFNDSIVGTGNIFTTPLLSANATYTARVFNSSSCTTVYSFPIKVYVKEIAGPTNLTNISSAVCPGDSVTLRAASANGAPLQWVIQNSPPIGIGDSIRIAVVNGATYLVRSGTTPGCYSATTTVPITITPTPTGTIGLSGTTITSTNLFDSYVLLKDGIQIAQSTTTGTFTFNNATCGSYQALFTNTVNSCAPQIDMFMRRQSVGTGCDNIIISGIPGGLVLPATVQGRKGGGTYTAPVAITGFTTILNNLCTVVGGNNNTELRIVGANGCTYFFSQATSSITTSTTPTLKLANYLEGDFLTTCTIRSNTVTIGANAPNISPFSTNLIRCQGQTATIQASGSGTLRWYSQPTGGTILSTGTNFTTPPLSATTTFYVESFAGGCVSARTPVTVSVNPVPTVIITQVLDTLSTSAQGVQYQWFFNGSSISGANSTFYVPTQSGNYTVQVITAQSCSATSNPFNFTVTGLNWEEWSNNLLTYPNPFENELKLDLPVAASYRLLNLLGKEVMAGSLPQGTSTLQTDGLASGTYLLMLQSGERMHTVKVIK